MWRELFKKNQHLGLEINNSIYSGTIGQTQSAEGMEIDYQ